MKKMFNKKHKPVHLRHLITTSTFPILRHWRTPLCSEEMTLFVAILSFIAH